tara:strand:- start:119 stop:325 length:207 start_codon:yes stop_codon:yes gene_type:complete
MYKFILVVLVGGFAFSGTLDNASVSISKDNFKKEVCFAKDSEKVQDNTDRRRRGKGSKGRRRGGSGLR